MRIAVFEANKGMEIREIGEELENLQAVVGGLIEVPFVNNALRDRNIDLVCNDEGMFLELEPSLVLANGNTLKAEGIIWGTCFLVSHEGSEFVSLTDEQIEYIKEITLEGAYQMGMNGKVLSIQGIKVV